MKKIIAYLDLDYIEEIFGNMEEISGGVLSIEEYTLDGVKEDEDYFTICFEGVLRMKKGVE